MKETDRAYLDNEALKFDDQFKKVIKGLQGVSNQLREWKSVGQEAPKELYEYVLDGQMGACYGMGRGMESPYSDPAENKIGNHVDIIIDMINKTHNDDKEVREQWNRILDQARFAQSAHYAICTIVGEMRHVDYDFRAKASTLSREV